MSESTSPLEVALATTINRRAFAARGLRWMLGGGALLVAGCGTGGSAASKEDIEALRAEVASLKDGGSTADAHGTPAAADHAAKPGAATAHDTAHWSYEGQSGPEAWANLAPENAVCSSGSAQSPIDIGATQPGAGGRTVFKWQPAALTLVNNGHTIQADVTDGGGIEVDGVPYALAQFHFHAPSEHTLKGKRFAMETHFVHKNAKGELAVIGVLHESGGQNAALAPIWSSLPRTTNDKPQVAKFDPAALLPTDRTMFRYAGSLTTPPCTEGVRWHVMQVASTVSPQQLSAFQEIIKPNARPVQPIKARDVAAETYWKLR